MELVREADHAMYEAKKAARRVTFDLAAFARGAESTDHD
jgi:GGDEF domain-containing protein